MRSILPIDVLRYCGKMSAGTHPGDTYTLTQRQENYPVECRLYRNLISTKAVAVVYTLPPTPTPTPTPTATDTSRGVGDER